MAYTQLTQSPATIRFAESLGATGLHMGILGAMPYCTLFMQFVAAVLANHLKYRRRVFLTIGIMQRLVLLPLAIGAAFAPPGYEMLYLWLLILATAANHAMANFCMPLWLSWMGDYLPRQGLSEFWGARHRWMQWAAAISLLGSAFYLWQSGLPIRVAYAGLIGVGSVLGVLDLLLFLKVEEPPVTQAKELRLGAVLTAPFRQPGYRSFISYACFWNFAAMIGAPFISWFLLSWIGMSLYQIMVIWTFSWIGGALFADRLGRWTERYGNRPMLIMCTFFKSANMIALLLIPRDPNVAFLVLVPIFMLDAVLNAGIVIANNGFMLKNSPSENRSMYIAAGAALAGMVGGLTSIGAGAFLALAADWEWRSGDWTFTNFHVLFAASLVLRWASVLVAVRIHEPASKNTLHVVTQLIGATPLRLLRLPVLVIPVEAEAKPVPAPRRPRPLAKADRR
ncbi:Major Facilitator Superfamily protein [Lignipirellula cremea]|uniref:Major Facilitator Superfamily protein n=2 Tax=Lignipirellula cremea TaxID=2528010 RepID=A0A518DYU2_9BACT|nr:Major Facilitator Superfamily protein [Lignipirellula cremea]